MPRRRLPPPDPSDTDRLGAAARYAGADRPRQKRPRPAPERERLLLRAAERADVARASLLESVRLVRVALRTTAELGTADERRQLEEFVLGPWVEGLSLAARGADALTRLLNPKSSGGTPCD